MNYELCKKLKDAGFPQRALDGKLYQIKEEYKNSKEVLMMDPTLPNLSELIEACGDEFRGLIPAPHLYNKSCTVTKVDDEEVNWRADGVIGCALGKTPEESVAKLWLKLNEKETNP